VEFVIGWEGVESGGGGGLALQGHRPYTLLGDWGI
jgi:hypothetical protein